VLVFPYDKVQIGELSITPKRGGGLITLPNQCAHRNLLAIEDGEVIRCKDCDTQVSAFWAFLRFSREYERFKEDLEIRAKEVIESEKRGVILKAAQRVEQAWRRRKMVPTCPHCRQPILPTDGFGNSCIRKIHAVEVSCDRPTAG
jgi:hypothetical protein